MSGSDEHPPSNIPRCISLISTTLQVDIEAADAGDDTIPIPDELAGAWLAAAAEPTELGDWLAIALWLVYQAAEANSESPESVVQRMGLRFAADALVE